MENETNNKKKGLSKNHWLLIILVLLIAIVLALVLAMPQEKELEEDTTKTTPVTPILDEDEDERPEPIDTSGSHPVVPGSSIVMDDIVVTPEGQPVKTDVAPGSPEAPRQSGPVSAEDLPESVIQLEISSEGFVPNQFTVEAGSVVSFSLTSTDEWSHSFHFEDPSLRAVALGVRSGEVRSMTFNAPTTPGEYPFFCDLRGHKARGEVGVMIVQ